MIRSKINHVVQNLLGSVYIDGEKVKWEEWSAEIPAFDESDNITIRLPWMLFEDGIMASNEKTKTKLVTGKNIPVLIKLKNKDLLNGIVSEPKWDFSLAGDSVEITALGSIGRMVEHEVVRNIKNRTASSVVNEIFSYHGIKGTVKSTSRKIGTYSADSQTSQTEMNDWQLLNWLAEWEGFCVRVIGKTGFFGPFFELPEIKKEPITFTYGKDCEIQSLSRRSFGAREVIVEGRSYYNKRTIVEYYPRKPKKEDEKAIVKRFTLTGLSQEQLRKRIKSIHGELTKYDLTGTLITQKYVEILPDRRINLNGVGMSLSQTYYATKVKLNENNEGGITTEIDFSSKSMEVSE